MGISEAIHKYTREFLAYDPLASRTEDGMYEAAMRMYEVPMALNIRVGVRLPPPPPKNIPALAPLGPGEPTTSQLSDPNWIKARLDTVTRFEAENSEALAALAAWKDDLRRYVDAAKEAVRKWLASRKAHLGDHMEELAREE